MLLTDPLLPSHSCARPDLDDSYPEAIRRDVTTISLARLSGRAVYRYVGPFIAVIAHGLDVTVSELGVALTITGISDSVCRSSVGSSTASRRTAIVGGLAGVSVGGFITATSTGIVGFTVGLFIVSTLGMVLVVGAGAWIADHVPFERRGRVVGLVETWWALGLLVGVSTLGLITSFSSWRWATPPARSWPL